MTKLFSCSVAMLLALQAPAGAAQNAAPTLAAEIDAALAPLYLPANPGATIIVLIDGKPVFRKAYGMADVANKVVMTPETSLRLGSITKQFTAVGILLLAEDGKLALSDEISKFFPGYPTQGKTITIEHLLTHTSGIVSYTSKPGFRAQSTKDLTPAQMIDTFKAEPMQFAPGTRWQYNNSGYFLLGAIIEKVSGMPYAKFVEQRLFIPLQMDHTAYEGFERTASMRAVGHARDQGRFIASAPLSMSQPFAAGALVSTVDDLARWDAAISAGKLIGAASWKKAFTPYVLADGKPTSYGYGWEVGKLKGVPMIAHGGDINGFASYALRLPEQKVYVAVLTNLEGGATEPEVVASRIAAITIGKPFPRTVVKLDAKLLEAYSGVYQAGDDVTRTVTRDKDQLRIQRTGRPPATMTAYSDHGFLVDNALVTVEFKRDATGKVQQLAFTLPDGAVTVNPRVGDTPPEVTAVAIAPALLDLYAGRYEVAPGFVLVVRRDGDRLVADAPGEAPAELSARSDAVFAVAAMGAEVRFERDAEGKVTQLVLISKGRQTPAKRLR